MDRQTDKQKYIQTNGSRNKHEWTNIPPIYKQGGVEEGKRVTGKTETRRER